MGLPELTADVAERCRRAGAWQERTFHELIDGVAAEDPAKEAVCDQHRRLSYADLVCQSNALAQLLIDAGIAEGECVAIQSGNRVELAIAHVACSRAGATFVPMSDAWRATELRHILGASRARVAIVPAVGRPRPPRRGPRAAGGAARAALDRERGRRRRRRSARGPRSRGRPRRPAGGPGRAALRDGQLGHDEHAEARALDRQQPLVVRRALRAGGRAQLPRPRRRPRADRHGRGRLRVRRALPAAEGRDVDPARALEPGRVRSTCWRESGRRSRRRCRRRSRSCCRSRTPGRARCPTSG